jgi:hypothetical protein
MRTPRTAGSFDDPAVGDGGLSKVTVFEDRHGTDE